MIKTTGTFKSSNKINDIAYFVYTPEREINPKAILQISHGMCEYIERYEEFAEFLTSNGIVVCGNDHLGHGKTAVSNDELGYFGKNNGDKHLMSDLHLLHEILRQKYRRLPYVLFGHSMGSFVVRSYMTAENYGKEIDGVVLCGTSGVDLPIKSGLLLANVISTMKGKKYRSKTLRHLMFKNYNNQFTDENHEFSWLTKDCEIRNKYINDEHCNFMFTANGYRDMFKLMKNISTENWVKDIPLSLPIFIISGADDPVGDYGKGVQTIYDMFVESEVNDITLKLYTDNRHEILNEINRQEVFQDILEFIERVYDGYIEANKI